MMNIPLGPPFVVPNTTEPSTTEKMPWQLNPSCGHVEITQSVAGNLSVAIPHRLIEASQSRMEDFET